MPQTLEEKLAVSRAWKARNRKRCKEMRSAYYRANQEIEREQRRRWAIENPERLKELEKSWREKNAEKINSKRKTPEHRARQNAKSRVRYREDKAYHCEKRIRAAITQAIRLYGDRKKKCPTDELIGCMAFELVRHIENRFKPGMTWDNIHIDHKRPCSSFDLSKREQQLECFHYSNLQPLFAIDNLKKGNR